MPVPSDKQLLVVSTVAVPGVQGRHPQGELRPTRSSSRRALGRGRHMARCARRSRQDTFDVRVILAPRGGVAALKAAVVATTTPGSRRFRRFPHPCADPLRV